MRSIGCLVGLLVLLVAFAPGTAVATQGHKVLRSNWTLTEAHFGNVTIDADNVILDCAGNQIHSSSFSSANCEGNTQKCAVAAEGRRSVVVKNCYVVGGNYFQHGVWFKNMTQSGIFSTLVSNTKRHGFVVDGGGDFPSGLFFLTATNMGSTSGTGLLINGVSGLTGRGLEHAGNSHGNGVEIRNSHNINLADLDMTPEAASPQGIGVHIAGSQDVIVRELNTPFRIVDYSTAGLLVESSTRINVSGPWIYNCETVGFELRNTTQSSFTNIAVLHTEDSCDTRIDAGSVFNSFDHPPALGICCGNCPPP